MMSSNDDEYTDYSCSTSLERLARDVETVLRSWHVVDGSDRHVSKTTTRKSSTTRKHLIRSQEVTWQLTYHHHQATTTTSDNNSLGQLRLNGQVALELALWDAPLLRTASTSSRKSKEENEEKKTSASDLPFSLQQQQNTAPTLPENLFSNFASLFGIGQHITLTPMNPELLEEEIAMAIENSVKLRHELRTADSILSSWLQTGLNLAATNCHCVFPVFGVWGLYQPSQPQKTDCCPIAPWIQQHGIELEESTLTTTTPPRRRRRQNRQPQQHRKNRTCLPPLLSGQLLSPNWSAHFECTSIPYHKSSSSSLSHWGKVLMQHARIPQVELWGARHVYEWNKPKTKKSLSLKSLILSSSDRRAEWRQYAALSLVADEEGDAAAEFVVYRDACEKVAASLLEQAAGANRDEPQWGPPEDPIATLRATVTWNGAASRDSSSRSSADPLLTLPIQTRSKKCKRSDWLEMQQATERMILDPETTNSDFVLETLYDDDTGSNSLAATLRCCLAALIRCAILTPETSCTQLIDDAIESWDCESGNRLARQLAQTARTSATTLALVEAMDWSHALHDMIDVRQAEEIVQHRVMNASLVHLFPTAPLTTGSEQAKQVKPLLRGAPPGRLLSLLFTHMARVRSPSSMALVWTTFCLELRRRWDDKEFLPNMKHVLGIDGDLTGRAIRQYKSDHIGVKADNSAVFNSSEPDPDETNCLIGQKLQLFNVCLEEELRTNLGLAESASSEETTEEPPMSTPTQQLEKRPRLSSDEFDALAPGPADTAAARSLMNGTLTANGKVLQTNSSHSASLSRAASGSEDEFFDASEEGSVCVTPKKAAPPANNGKKMPVPRILQNVEGTRKGVRCPVQGKTLLSNGEQLFAPYLQRCYPLTDDVVKERRHMLARQTADKITTCTGQRLEIAHRHQRPKLESDMSAFKAANPGAAFEDFVAWYGNPTNPLDDYDGSDDASVVSGFVAAATAAENKQSRKRSSGNRSRSSAVSCNSSVQSGKENGSRPRVVRRTSFESTTTSGSQHSKQANLDKAAEAIRVLKETREFWTVTWKNAKPIAASEQVPLFNSSNTLEMALDYFENLHPANLLCQVMAGNLTSAYMILSASAGQAVERIETVRKSLRALRRQIDAALQALADDVMNTDASTSAVIANERHPHFSCSVASVSSIFACEQACVALAETELLVSHAVSLLSKLTGQWDLVEQILAAARRKSTTTTIRVSREQDRKGVHAMLGASTVPKVQEYLFRSSKKDSPCQLVVRQEVGDTESLTLAVAKCQPIL